MIAKVDSKQKNDVLSTEALKEKGFIDIEVVSCREIAFFGVIFIIT